MLSAIFPSQWRDIGCLAPLMMQQVGSDASAYLSSFLFEFSGSTLNGAAAVTFWCLGYLSIFLFMFPVPL